MRIITALFLGALISSVSLSADIQKLIKQKGCISCHDISKEKVGPPFKVIAKEYKGKDGALQILVQSMRSGSVGKWQSLAQKHGIRVTAFYMPRQPVSEEEARKIAEWILSLE